MTYKILLKKKLLVLGLLSGGLFVSSESGAQSTQSWSEAREVVALSKKRLDTPSSKKKETSFFFSEPSHANLQKAEEILDAAQQPAFKKAATFVEKVTGPRCQAPPLGDLMGKDSAFGRARAHPPVLVFVTLSMRDDVLKTLYREVNKIGGRLVLRGLVEDSFAQTRERLMALKIGAEIDPPAFEAFKIKRVPTFVYIGQDVQETDKTPPHDRLQGNVSLAYALEQFKNSGDIAGAGELLARLGGV